MKSNVKVADVTRLRVTALAVLGLAACKSSPDSDGLVVVPMAETAGSTTEDIADAAPEAAPHRIAIEPHAPANQGSCTRDVNCVAQLTSPPPYPYGHPYEKCDPAPLGETGHFSPMETNQKRHDDPNLCCYVSFSGCSRRVNTRRGGGGRVMIGRPLRDAGGAEITARAEETSAWARAAARAERDETRADFWAKGATLEHASVAEFARISLALLALGAPAELVRDVHRAALDEIDHARTCFSMASRFAGRDIGPGPLDVSRASMDASVASLVRDALRDGCLGESCAALELRAMARDESDAEISAALDAMAADEERHAALAWRIVDFAMTRDEDATRDAIARFLSELDDDHLLRGFAAMDLVAREVLRPCALALMSRGPRRSPREGDCAREA